MTIVTSTPHELCLIKTIPLTSLITLHSQPLTMMGMNTHALVHITFISPHMHLFKASEPSHPTSSPKVTHAHSNSLDINQAHSTHEPHKNSHAIEQIASTCSHLHSTPTSNLSLSHHVKQQPWTLLH